MKSFLCAAAHVRLVAALALLLIAAPSAFAAEARRPNILFLFADDQRFDTLSCAGHEIVRTPVIDGLAAKGVRFRNAFVTTPVCWVSRAVVLTGQWARTHADRNSVPTCTAESLATIYPVELRKAGYRTGFFGKWHLLAPEKFEPAAQFDEFEAIGRNPYFKTLPDGTKRHETDLICDRGIDFIQRQSKDKPFCLNLWFNAAHAEDGDKRPGIGHYPWPQSVDGMYEDVAVPAPRLNNPLNYDALPQFLKDSLNRERFFWGYDTPEKYETNVRAYYRMISGIDHAIGRVLKALDAAGLADNTIVVYSADNGYYLGDRGFQGKWSHFDQSLRVPLVIYDPQLQLENRGQVYDAFALNVDLPATFIDWAGVAKPAGYEGESLAPLIEGRSMTDWRSHFFCEHLDLPPTLTWEGVRGEQFVYARYFDQRPVFEFLHDLETDPDELANVAGHRRYAKALAEMRKLCDEEIAQRGGPLAPLEERKMRKNRPARKAQRNAAQPAAKSTQE